MSQSKAKDMTKDVSWRGGEGEEVEAELHSVALLGQAAGPGEAPQDGSSEGLRKYNGHKTKCQRLQSQEMFWGNCLLHSSV